MKPTISKKVMKMKKISDEELKEFLRVGDPEKKTIITCDGGSLYIDYCMVNLEDLPYNKVLCAYVWGLGDIEMYLYEEYVCRDDDCILKDKEVMQRAIDLIEQGFEPEEDN